MLNNEYLSDGESKYIGTSKVRKFKIEFEKSNLAKNSFFYNTRIRKPNISKIEHFVKKLSKDEKSKMPKVDGINLRYRRDIWTTKFFIQMNYLLKLYESKI